MRIPLLAPRIGLVRNGLVAEYRFNEGAGQTLTDYSGYGYHGQLGGTTGADANDPTWTGQGLSFAADDYVKLPYMINAEQDFTVYLVANVEENAPAVQSYLFSMGNSGTVTQYAGITREVTGDLRVILQNNAGAYAVATILSGSVAIGIRLLKFQRINNLITLKDVGSGKISNSANAPVSPITYNQMALGVLLRTGTYGFLNQPEYFATFYPKATTDKEDQQVYRYAKKLLAGRGISLA